jgi:hypothetical protein
MSVLIRILRFITVFFMMTVLTVCAPAKKNSYFEKRKKGTQITASQLGRNKYFFSSGYQKKLSKSYQKKR